MSAGAPDLDPRDRWYRSEEPTRAALTFELRRIARRFRARPLPALAIAAALTALIAIRVTQKRTAYEADVVLAITEGTALGDRNGIPFNQLREYVWSVLLPDAKLLALIEDRDLVPLRRKLGPQYALDELRGQIDLQIWRNSFLYYEGADSSARKSARIGLSVTDGDPDFALALAQDLASIITETHDEKRDDLARKLAHEVDALRGKLEERRDGMQQALTVRQAEIAAASARGEEGVAGTLRLEVIAVARKIRDVDEQLALIARSPEALADRAAAAGLGMRVEVVSERRPDRPEQSGLVPVMVVIVVGTGALLGCALFFGAFDSRVHDTDDVARLGLPVLGQVPGFSGDHVGSLRARGAARRRVPWWLRWRSPR
jgi:hypothetical protein